MGPTSSSIKEVRRTVTSLWYLDISVSERPFAWYQGFNQSVSLRSRRKRGREGKQERGRKMGDWGSGRPWLPDPIFSRVLPPLSLPRLRLLRRVSISVHYRLTDSHSYLLFSSFHPSDVKTNLHPSFSIS